VSKGARGRLALLMKKELRRFNSFFAQNIDRARDYFNAKKYTSLLTVVPVIAITVVLFIYREEVARLGNWGYLGAFLIGLVGNATIVLPMPGLLLLFALGVTFNPVLIGLTGAAGGAIGELSGYILGFSGHIFVKNNRFFIRAEDWMRRWGSATIFVFALIPFLPIDIAGIAAGALRFNVWKFLGACYAGKALLYVGLTVAAAWGWHSIEGWFA
jgi:membrane protein DedA with SNARE-associated domain